MQKNGKERTNQTNNSTNQTNNSTNQTNNGTNQVTTSSALEQLQFLENTIISFLVIWDVMKMKNNKLI